MSSIVPKETIVRLVKDVKQLIKNPLTDNGIYYIHDDSDMMKGYVLIIGQPDTPYFGGNYFFELDYPVDYPHSPPKVTYWTNGDGIRFNPNLYKCGKVCISLLNTWRGDQWTSCQTISTVLLTLCTLLCKDPLLNEPGVNKGHEDLLRYTEIIEYSNIDIAVCNIIDKKTGYYVDFFDKFKPFIKENFIKNYDALLEFTSNKMTTDYTKKKNVKCRLYNMSVDINYHQMFDKLKNSKLILENV
jgi:ubiquitin-protein ligase